MKRNGIKNAAIGKTLTYTSLLRATRKGVVISDILIVGLSPLFTNAIKWHNVFALENRNLKDFIFILLLCLLWCFALSQSNAWDSAGLDNRYDIYRAPLLAAGKVILTFSTFAYIFRFPFSREWVLIQIIGTISTVIISRGLINANFRTSVNYSENLKPLTYLIVSCDSEFQEICDQFISKYEIRPDFVHMKFDGRISPKQLGLKIYKKTVELQAEGLILKSDATSADRVLKSVQHLRQPKHLAEVIYVSELDLLIHRMQPIDQNNWFRLSKAKLVESQSFIKRALDITLSLFAIILLAPLFIIIALLIKTTSKGPVFYVSKRVGRFNKPLTFIKFRTMIESADAQRAQALGAGVNENLDDYTQDYRITPIGKFLRRWSIDETPQFFHVLMGTMSLVGPRPILFEELVGVPSDSSLRFIAKPGLTGIWQISGRKSVLWEDRMKQDIQYVESWTFLGDIRLIIKTFATVISGHGAA